MTAKKLSKKYKLQSKIDLQQAVNEITTNQDLRVYLGCDLYKKRVKNSSIPTGKSWNCEMKDIKLSH